MANPETKARKAGDPSPEGPPRKQRDRLLILEPEDLVRWSLETYLAKWFEISTAGSQNTAIEILDHQHVDALVVSDDLSSRSTGRIVAHARKRNPQVRIVRTVSSPPGKTMSARSAPCIEKPFQLAELASLLMP